jgi:acetate kinase
MADAVLVLNSGSSSIKLGLFDLSSAEPGLLCKGLLDEHEASPRIVFMDPAGKTLFQKHRAASDTEEDHLLVEVLAWVEDYLGGSLGAVGHRVVHGGPNFSEPVKLTDGTLAALDALTLLAPLHQPRCLAPIRSIRSFRPDLIQIACFDTAFHHGLAPPVSRLAIPRRFEQKGLRRYGFHGLSFEYVAGRLAEISPALSSKRAVIAHLGNGASLCALRDGRSLDTTMGLTPLDGLVMGTRCGTIDPGVVLYLQQGEGLSVDEVQQLLYHESGLLGISGISSDMRALLASSEPAAKEAIDLFAFRVAQETAVMANTLGGLECLVFTGGIGEHSQEIRALICERLQWLGVRIDNSANEANRTRVDGQGSAVEILVIPTDEAMTIARHCAARLAKT